MDLGYFYRITDHLVSAGVDEFDNPLGPPQNQICIHKLKVLKQTNKGVWVDNYGGKRFVLQDSRKKFANSCIEEAVISFKARKKQQASILNRQLSRIEYVLREVDNVVYRWKKNEISLEV